MIVKRIVDGQIRQGIMKEEERKIYYYGYQMLLELVINLLSSIFIGVLLDAPTIVLVFTVTYLSIRGYVGGYHAKTGAGCFLLSAGMLVLAIFAVRSFKYMAMERYVWGLEIVFLSWIFYRAPVPVPNKPITEKEKKYFRKRIFQIYLLQLIAEGMFWYIGKESWGLTVLLVHFSLCVLVSFKKSSAL